MTTLREDKGVAFGRGGARPMGEPKASNRGPLPPVGSASRIARPRQVAMREATCVQAPVFYGVGSVRGPSTALLLESLLLPSTVEVVCFRRRCLRRSRGFVVAPANRLELRVRAARAAIEKRTDRNGVGVDTGALQRRYDAGNVVDTPITHQSQHERFERVVGTYGRRAPLAPLRTHRASHRLARRAQVFEVASGPFDLAIKLGKYTLSSSHTDGLTPSLRVSNQNCSADYLCSSVNKKANGIL